MYGGKVDVLLSRDSDHGDGVMVTGAFRLGRFFFFFFRFSDRAFNAAHRSTRFKPLTVHGACGGVCLAYSLLVVQGLKAVPMSGGRFAGAFFFRF